ncbi:MAG: DUF721 domain-containing protein [Bacteroidales bacterium]|nr:DUF721 domain-containing protein [Bacteroidales bacterium]
MRKSNTQKISDLLKEFVKDSHIEDKLSEVSLVKEWEEIVGKTMARYTKRIFIKEGTLFVYLNSSVARHELMMLREGLISEMNKRAGKELVKEMVVK